MDHVTETGVGSTAGRQEQGEVLVDNTEQIPQHTATPVRISDLSLLSGCLGCHDTHFTLQVGTPISDLPRSFRLPPKPQYYISTTFHAELLLVDMKPDILLISSDDVLFYAHKSFLLSSSDNTFNGLLAQNAIRTARGGTARSLCVVVPADSILFNVVLHTIYGLSCRQFNPSLDVLLQAVKMLKTYGIAIGQVIELNTPLFHHIVVETPKRPVEVFLVAAENGLDTLAVRTSAHLHSLLLPQITDEMARRMGPRYLKRLLKLHADRVEYLKLLILDAPKPHEEAIDCGATEQEVLVQAWDLAKANLVVKVRPGENTGTFQQERCLLCFLGRRYPCERVAVHVRVAGRGTPL